MGYVGGIQNSFIHWMVGISWENQKRTDERVKVTCDMSQDTREEQDGRCNTTPSSSSSFEDELMEALLDTRGSDEEGNGSRRKEEMTTRDSSQGDDSCVRKRKRDSESTRRRRMDASTSSGPGLGLTDVHLDCLERIVSRLSPNALCCVSQVCTLLNRLASSQSLWKALYHVRWPSGNELIGHDDIVGDVPWKMLYLRQDAEEIEKGERIDDGQGQLYLQMARAFREHTLTNGQSAKTLCIAGSTMCIPGSVSEHVERFKILHGIRNDGSKDHSCEYVRLVGHHWICQQCAALHVCGEYCEQTSRCAGDDMMVCQLTGCCSREMISTEYKVEDGHPDGNHEEAGMSGRLGRAFFAGYNAADNKEMLRRFGVSIED